MSNPVSDSLPIHPLTSLSSFLSHWFSVCLTASMPVTEQPVQRSVTEPVPLLASYSTCMAPAAPLPNMSTSQSTRLSPSVNFQKRKNVKVCLPRRPTSYCTCQALYCRTESIPPVCQLAQPIVCQPANAFLLSV